MDASQPKRLAVVPGESIGQSMSSVVGEIGCGFCVLLVCVICVTCGVWLTGRSWLDVLEFKGSFGSDAFFATLACVALVSWGIYKLIRGERLILGANRLQHATRWGRVLTQIPYGNIIAVHLEPQCIRINLRSRKYTNTLIPESDPWPLSGLRDLLGVPPDYVINSKAWQLPLEEIHKRLLNRLEAFRAERAPRPPTPDEALSRDDLKRRLSGLNADSSLPCPFCKAVVKTKNMLRHCDEQHSAYYR